MALLSKLKKSISNLQLHNILTISHYRRYKYLFKNYKFVLNNLDIKDKQFDFLRYIDHNYIYIDLVTITNALYIFNVITEKKYEFYTLMAKSNDFEAKMILFKILERINVSSDNFSMSNLNVTEYRKIFNINV